MATHPSDALPSGQSSLNFAFSSALVSASLVHMESPPVIHEGWVLKKRRKKMQGFARRYFTLYQSGMLSYAFEPGQPTRDHIFLHNAAISTTPGRKDVHIDSNTATFHIKCLSTEDFETWMSSFRQFVAVGLEAKKAAFNRHSVRKASLSLNLNRSGTLLEEMGSSLADLENSISTLHLDANPTRALNISKKHGSSKESKFALFKRPHNSHATTETSSLDHVQEGHRPSLAESVQEVKAKFEVVKSQYDRLLKVVQDSLNDSGQLIASLPATVEEEELPESYGHRTSTPVTGTRKSVRDSMTTTSDSVMEWFDAVEDGPQEFILDMGQDASEPGSRLISSSAETSSVDTDFESMSASGPMGESVTFNAQQVIRRTQLPCLPPSDEGSLFAILKKNVGKDLSTITFPVTFNEPLTMLQRAAEEVEYYSLLDEAAKAQDPVLRLSYIAAFAISGYAHTRHRSGRKGFNPMLAETYEDVRAKFIAEKVRHNPLEIAYHAEGENWDLTATSSGKTKFWGKSIHRVTENPGLNIGKTTGKSLEIIPLGVNRLKIGSDSYVWKKPSSFMRNLMVGTKYFEHSGKMTIENTMTQHRCVLDFKQNGYWGPANVVSGTIHDADGDIVGNLEGKWDDQICQMLDTSHFHVLWKIAPFPKNAPESYGFTSYGITLNEIANDSAGKLPPTDSRLRPDVRALENGELDLAEEEKLRVEQMQRDRRNRGEERGPRWFKQVGDEWHYTGGYWEARSRGWKQEKILPLW